MQVRHLHSVNGEVVIDLAEECAPTAFGPTLLVEGIVVDESAAAARSATMAAATFGMRSGGLAVSIRPRLIDTDADTCSRLLEELQPSIAGGQVATEPGLGVHLDLPGAGGVEAPVLDETVDGVTVRRSAAVVGVVAAVEGAVGPLGGVTVAIDSFDPRARAVCRSLCAAGARLVAVSNSRGAIADGTGLDLDSLVGQAERSGESFILDTGLELHRPAELYELPVDVVVTMAGIGVIDRSTAQALRARALVPGVPVPWTEGGLEHLRQSPVLVVPDFVATAAGVLLRRAPVGLGATEVLAMVRREVAGMVKSARAARVAPIDYASDLARTFLSTWIPREVVDQVAAAAPAAPDIVGSRS